MIDILFENIWAQVTLLSLVVAIVAVVSERRRERRRRLDSVGFMPWTAIMVLAMIVALVAAALAIVRG